MVLILLLAVLITGVKIYLVDRLGPPAEPDLFTPVVQV